MKYMLLIYLDEDGLSETERAECYKDSAQFAVELSKRGVAIGGPAELNAADGGGI